MGVSGVKLPWDEKEPDDVPNELFLGDLGDLRELLTTSPLFLRMSGVP